MKKDILIIGLGEIGTAIKRIEEEAGNIVHIIEKDYSELDCFYFNVVHVCIPYTDNFVDIVVNYLKQYTFEVCIIHSTVKVGTTTKIAKIGNFDNIVHSFCRGVHPNLYEGIKTFEKPIGVANVSHFEETNKTTDYLIRNKVRKHYDQCNIPHKTLRNSETSEMAKLLDTTYYGYNILFAKYVNEICNEHNLSYDEVYTWANETYNDGYTKLGKTNVIRPILYPPKGEIGGQCVVPNFHLLPDGVLKDWCLNDE